ncbi:MAG TPA: prepilin-type N-terminal cleavage/methylation domain-containing protein [Fimbriimonas sp.]|nr:prepilin-type N-terminal cleavage/methylation domain-containing protein [Fimbriimonas sp.]
MKHAFTLIELLVVIAIIAILAAILFPVFAQAKLAAKKTVALSNAKQVGLGIQIYMNDYDDELIKSFFGFPSSPAGWGNVYYNWRFALAPYDKSNGLLEDPTDPYTGSQYAGAPYWDASYSLGDPHRHPYQAISTNYAVNSHIIGFANPTGGFGGAVLLDASGYPIFPPGYDSVTSLDAPADTIMIAPARTHFQDVKWFFGSKTLPDGSTPFPCSDAQAGAGNGWGVYSPTDQWDGTSYGAVTQTCPDPSMGAFNTVAKTFSLVWCDGHAKTMPYSRTIGDSARDHWFTQGDPYYPTAAQTQNVLNNLVDEYK